MRASLSVLASMLNRAERMVQRDSNGVEFSDEASTDSDNQEGLGYRKMSVHLAQADDNVDTYMSHHHFLRQGHKDCVVSIATSASLKIVVSGSVDGYARVWRYDKVHSQSYQLYTRIFHADPLAGDPLAHCIVSAVAVDPEGDIIATGTSDGDVFILARQRLQERRTHALQSMVGHHGGNPITDLQMVSSDDLSGNNQWNLASSGGSEVKITLIHNRRAPFTMQEKCKVLKHGSEVLRMRNIQVGGLVGKADIAVCAKDGLYLWNFAGELLVKLRHEKYSAEDATQVLGGELTGMAVSFDGFPDGRYEAMRHQADETLICACGTGLVSVWQLDGIDQRVGPQKVSPAPLVQLEWADVKDVELSADNRLLMELRDEGLEPIDKSNVRAWNFTVEDDEYEIEYTGEVTMLKPVQDILPAGEERIVAQLLFRGAAATSLRMAFNPSDGASVLTGYSSGVVAVWDLEGEDAGERVAELRSCTLAEVFMPLVLFLVSFVQVVSFAFGPQIQWNRDIHRVTSVVYRITVADFEWHLSIEKETIFWWKTGIVLAIMVTFILCAFFNLPLRTRKLGWKNIDRPGRRRFWRISSLLIRTLMWACSTVLVVVISTACAEMLDCARTQSNSRYVSKAPTVVCYEGSHLAVVIALPFVYVLFFCALVPYAVCAGDTNYVQPDEIFDPSAWRNNALRKATLVHTGPFHPRGHNVFYTGCAELLVKILLPVISTLTSRHPKRQMTAVTSVGVTWLITTVIWKPFVEQSCNVVAIGLRLYTVIAMACGLFTAFLADPDRREPIVLFSVCAVVVMSTIAFIACRMPKIHDHMRVTRLTTIHAEPVESVGFFGKMAEKLGLGDGDVELSEETSEGVYVTEDEERPLLPCCVGPGGHGL